MMPLSLAKINQKHVICKINGKDEIFKHLKNMGIVVGNEVSIVAKNDSNLIISIFDSRIGIDKIMATKILIREA